MPGLADLLSNPRRLRQFAETPGNYPAALQYASGGGRVAARPAPRASQARQATPGVLKTGELITAVELPDGTTVEPNTPSGTLAKVPGRSNLYVDPVTGEPYTPDPASPGGLRSAWASVRPTARGGRLVASLPGVGEKDLGPDPAAEAKAKAKEEQAKQKAAFDDQAEAYWRQGRPFRTDETGRPIPRQTDEEWQAQQKEKAAKALEEARVKDLRRKMDLLELDYQKVKTGLPETSKADEDLFAATRDELQILAGEKDVDTYAAEAAASEDPKVRAAAESYIAIRDRLKPAAEGKAKLKKLEEQKIDLQRQILEPEAWAAEKKAALPSMPAPALEAEAKSLTASAEADAGQAEERLKAVERGRQAIQDKLDAFLEARQNQEFSGMSAEEIAKATEEEGKLWDELLAYDERNGTAEEVAKATLRAASARREIADEAMKQAQVKREAAQQEKLAKLTTPEELDAYIKSADADLEPRLADFEQQAAALQAEAGQWQQKADDLAQRNAQARLTGIPASELVTLSNGEIWHAPLYQELTALQAQQQASAGDFEQRRRSLMAQQEGLQKQIALRNEAAQKAQTLAQTQRQRQRNILRFTPGYEQTAADMDSLDQEAQARTAVVAEMFPQDGPQRQAAMQAIEADIAQRAKQALAQGQQRAAAASAAYLGIQTRLRQDPSLRAGGGGLWVQARKNLAQALGISEQQADDLLEDQESQDWSSIQGKHGETIPQGNAAQRFMQEAAGDKRQFRVLKNGGLIINPKITEPEAYKAAVEAAPASPEAKAAAMARQPDLRQRYGAQALETLEAIGDAGWQTFRAAQKDATPEEAAARYADKLKADTGTGSKIARQIFQSMAQGVDDIGSQALGLLSGITGSETLMKGAQALQERAALIEADKRLRGAGGNYALDTLGQFSRLVPSLLPAAAGARATTATLALFGRTSVGARLLPALSSALRTAKTPAEATRAAQQMMQGAGLAGAAAAGGAQTYGAQLADIYTTLRREHPEMDHSTALRQAQLPSLLSGAVTALLTVAGGSTGVEKLLTSPATVKEAFKKAYTSQLQRAGAIGKSVVTGGLKELPEEIGDELFSSVASAVGTGQSVPQAIAQFVDSLPELAGAIFALGGFAEGVATFRETAAPDADQAAPAEGMAPPPEPEAPAPAPEPGPVEPAPPTPEGVQRAIATMNINGTEIPKAVADTAKRTNRKPVEVARHAASGLVKIAQGAKLENLDAREREALGYINKNGKIVADPKTTPLVELHKGELVIRTEAVEWLEAEEQPLIAATIRLTEAERRAQIDAQKSTGQAKAAVAEEPPQAGPTVTSGVSYAPEAGSTPAPATTETPTPTDEPQPQAPLPEEPSRGQDLPEPRGLPVVPEQPPAQEPEAATQPEPAASQPAVTAADEEAASASVPIQITRDMRQQLYDRGYTKEQVNKMKPAEAQAILNPPAQTAKPAPGMTPAQAAKATPEQKARAGKKSKQSPPSARRAFGKGAKGGSSYANFQSDTDADAYDYAAKMGNAMTNRKLSEQQRKAEFEAAKNKLARVAAKTGIPEAELRAILTDYTAAIREQAKAVPANDAFTPPTLAEFIANRAKATVPAAEIQPPVEAPSPAQAGPAPSQEPARPASRNEAVLQAANAAWQAERTAAQKAGDKAALAKAQRKAEAFKALALRLKVMGEAGVLIELESGDINDLQPARVEPVGVSEAKIIVNVPAFLEAAANSKTAQEAREFIQSYMQHEFIHKAAIAQMGETKIVNLWNALTPEAKEASRKLYYRGAKKQFPSDFHAAHEWFAQLIEARLNGKLSNQQVLEATEDPTFREQLTALLRDFIAKLRDIASALKDKAMAAQINAEADKVQAIVQVMDARIKQAAEAEEAGLDVQSKDKAAFYISEIRATNNGQSVFEVGVDKDGDGRSERELRRSFRTLAEAVAYGESYNIRNATPKPWALIGNTHVTRKEDANITIQGKPGEYEVVDGDYTRKFLTLKAVRDYLNARIFEGSDAYADQIAKLQVDDVAEMRAEYDTADIFTLKAEAKKAGLELDKKATKAEVIEALLNQMASQKAASQAAQTGAALATKAGLELGKAEGGQAEARASLIESIVTAARKPKNKIVPVFYLMGTDGKFHSANGFPRGVRSTGETKLMGYVQEGRDGVRVGALYATEEEAQNAIQKMQDNADQSLREALEAMPEDQLQSQADFWLKQKPQPAVEVQPQQKPAAVPQLLTGDELRDKRLQQYRQRKKEGKSMTASQESDFARLEKMAAIDPADWNVGMGVGFRVAGSKGTQINRGFRIVSINPETKTASIKQVADTGLTSTGGDQDRILEMEMSLADLVKDRKYDAPKPARQPSPAAQAARPAPPVTAQPEAEAKPAEPKSLALRTQDDTQYKGKTPQELLEIAAPYEQFGPDYNRNIAESAAWMRRALEMDRKFWQMNADELAVRLERWAKPALTPAEAPASQGQEAQAGPGRNIRRKGLAMPSGEADYRGAHKAPTGKFGEASLDAMDKTYPSDIYTAKGARFYGDGNPKMDADMHRILLRFRNKPDAKVKVYRAIPKGVNAEIQPGDWVTPSKAYAQMHGERWEEGSSILEKEVPAKELFTEGNSLYEFGWSPTPLPADEGQAGPGIAMPPQASQAAVTPAQDAEHLAAVEAGDLEKAQRMVNEAAKKAGAIDYEYGALWHATRKNFTTFKTPSFFSDSPEELIENQRTNKRHDYGDKLMRVFLFGKVKDAEIDSAWWSVRSVEDAEILKAQSEGYDVLRLTDGYNYFWVALNPSAIKSADPVTYDESGNVIPLSQRFNPASPSILYMPQLPAQDAKKKVGKVGKIKLKYALYDSKNPDSMGNGGAALEAEARKLASDSGGYPARPARHIDSSDARRSLERQARSVAGLAVDPPREESLAFLAKGGEHNAYIDSTDSNNVKVIKITIPGGYGFIGDEDIGAGRFDGDKLRRVWMRQATPAEYLHRLALFSHIFGVPVKLRRYQKNDALPLIVTEMPFVDGVHPSSNKPLIEYFTKLGFKAVDWDQVKDNPNSPTPMDEMTWYREEDGILVTDAVPRNFKIDKDTGALIPLDLMVSEVPLAARDFAERAKATSYASESTLYMPKPPAQAARQPEGEAGQQDAETARYLAELQAEGEAEAADAEAKRELMNDPDAIDAVIASQAMSARNLSKQFVYPKAREVYQALAAARDMLGGPETVKLDELRKWAKDQFDADPDAAVQWAMEAVEENTVGDEIGGQALLGEVFQYLSKQAVINPDLRKARNMVGNYYLDTGTRLAQTLAARRDPLETPQQRWVKAVDIVFGPDEKTRRRLRIAPTTTAKARRIASLEAQLAEAKTALEKAKLNERLEAARREETQDAIIEADMERSEKIKAKILRRMGVTEDDVMLTPEDRYSVQSAIMDLPAVKAALEGIEHGKDILRMAFKGLPDKHIANALNLNEGDVPGIIQNMVDKIVRPAVKAEVKAGNGFGGLMEAGRRLLAKAKRLVGLGMPPKARPLSQWKTLITGKKQTFDQVDAEVDRVLNFALQSPRKRNNGSLKSVVFNTPGGQRVRVYVPFDPNDVASYYAFAREAAAAKSGVLDKVYEYWINMPLLSGAATQYVNLIGGITSAVWNYTAQYLTEATLNALVFRNPDSPTYREYRHILKGFYRGFLPAIEMANMAYKTEGDVIRNKYLNEPLTIDIKDGEIDKVGNVRAAIGGKAGRSIRIPGRLLRWADAFNKTAILYAEVSAYAYRRAHLEAKRQNLTGKARSEFIDNAIAVQIANPGSQAYEDAIKVAEELLLQSDNAVTAVVTTMLGSNPEVARAVEKRIAEAETKGKTTELIGLNSIKIALWAQKEIFRWVWPFQKTPANMVRIGLRKAGGVFPIAAYHIGYALHQSINNKKPFTASYSKAMMIKDASEMALAVIPFMLLYGMMEGDDNDEEKRVLLTGSRLNSINPKLRGEKEAFQRQYGYGAESSIVFQDGKGNVTGVFNYGKYEPFGTWLTTWVDAVRNYKEVKRRRSEGENASYMRYMISSFAAQMESKSFLQGFSNLMESWRDIQDRKEDETVDPWAKAFMRNVIPNFIKQSFRSSDDYVRESKTAGFAYTGFPNPEIMPKTPAFEAQRKVTTTGQEIRKAGSPISRLLFRSNTVVTPQPDALLLRANRLNPSKSWYPTPLAKDDYTVVNPAARPGSPARTQPITDPAAKAEFARIVGGLYAAKSRRIEASLTPGQKASPGPREIEKYKEAMSEAKKQGKMLGGIRGLHKMGNPLTTNNKSK